MLSAIMASIRTTTAPSTRTAGSAWAIDLVDIRRFLERAGLARQKCPEHFVIIDELPRVPSGKVSKDAPRARAKALAEAGGPARRLDGTR